MFFFFLQRKNIYFTLAIYIISLQESVDVVRGLAQNAPGVLRPVLLLDLKSRCTESTGAKKAQRPAQQETKNPSTKLKFKLFKMCVKKIKCNKKLVSVTFAHSCGTFVRCPTTMDYLTPK